ncbi:Ubiquinone biosynthesis protein coq9, mitochondrial [Leucoagaricus sp. SymC.cos]|nr:Ubiquinone biosynthesis protein coq9, mitochondrial [Leucoagaricus sp. SymC.cos]
MTVRGGFVTFFNFWHTVAIASAITIRTESLSREWAAPPARTDVVSTVTRGTINRIFYSFTARAARTFKAASLIFLAFLVMCMTGSSTVTATDGVQSDETLPTGIISTSSITLDFTAKDNLNFAVQLEQACMIVWLERLLGEPWSYVPQPNWLIFLPIDDLNVTSHLEYYTDLNLWISIAKKFVLKSPLLIRDPQLHFTSGTVVLDPRPNITETNITVKRTNNGSSAQNIDRSAAQTLFNYALSGVASLPESTPWLRPRNWTAIVVIRPLDITDINHSLTMFTRSALKAFTSGYRRDSNVQEDAGAFATVVNAQGTTTTLALVTSIQFSNLQQSSNSYLRGVMLVRRVELSGCMTYFRERGLPPNTFFAIRLQEESLMAAQTRTRLLQLAIPLVKSHGFTRDALAQSVLHLPPPETHTSPLSDSAISALFGSGIKAEYSLINFFFDEGLERMRARAEALSASQERALSVKELFGERLRHNEPVLEHLSEAFTILASNSSFEARLGPFQLPPIDPVPGIQHALRIADEACYLSGDTSSELSWYARRASLAAIYTATELHQITSPHTANHFLESLLASSSRAEKSLDEIGLFSSYLFKSCKGIIKSTGVL